MKVKLKNIFETIPVLNVLAQTKFKPTISYRINRLIRSLQSHFEDIQKEQGKLLKDNGATEDEKGMHIEREIEEKELVDGEEVVKKVINPKFIKFAKEFDEFLNTEIEFELKFPLNLNDIESADLTPIQIDLIDPFINTENL